MTKRGRRSAASLSVVQTLPGQRPEPPRELTREQKAIWRAVVQTKPADWFTDDSHPLLVAYCRHITTARDLGATIDGFDLALLAEDEHLKRYDRLLAMRERETRAITALARSMRLTQQARYDTKSANTAAKSAPASRPWEYRA